MSAAGVMLTGGWQFGGIPSNDGILFGGNAEILKAQTLAVLLVVTWTAFWTSILMYVIQKTVGCNVNKKIDIIGLDLAYHDEVAYDSVFHVPEWEKTEEKHLKIGQVIRQLPQREQRLTVCASAGFGGCVERWSRWNQAVGKFENSRAPAGCSRLRRPDCVPRRCS